MGGILECDGVFQVFVPEGWSVVGQPGRAFDLSHLSEDVGVNISVYPRRPGGRDIQEALRSFARTAGADVAQLGVVLADEDETQSRAYTRFAAADREWLAGFVYVADAAVLVTSNCSIGDETAFAAGQQVVMSLGPVASMRRPHAAVR